MISVIIIGAGNVAHHLFNAFNTSKEVVVKQWYSRSLDKIKSFKNEVEIIDDFTSIEEADLYILAVSDDALVGLSSKLPFENRLVVHTSGTVNIHDLDKKNRRGVFYPLQTFSKDVQLDFANVPVCIEVLDKSDLKLLKSLAKAIGSPSHKVNTNQRKSLHLAAVFVNNFTNQMYRIAHEITEAQGVEFEILKPLITETARKVQQVSPYTAQTGPAKRNDKKTIKKHLDLLEQKQHQEIYKLMTASIQKTHGISTSTMGEASKKTTHGRKKL